MSSLPKIERQQYLGSHGSTLEVPQPDREYILKKALLLIHHAARKRRKLLGNDDKDTFSQNSEVYNNHMESNKGTSVLNEIIEKVSREPNLTKNRKECYSLVEKYLEKIYDEYIEEKKNKATRYRSFVDNIPKIDPSRKELQMEYSIGGNGPSKKEIMDLYYKTRVKSRNAKRYQLSKSPKQKDIPGDESKKNNDVDDRVFNSIEDFLLLPSIKGINPTDVVTDYDISSKNYLTKEEKEEKEREEILEKKKKRLVSRQKRVEQMYENAMKRKKLESRASSESLSYTHNLSKYLPPWMISSHIKSYEDIENLSLEKVMASHVNHPLDGTFFITSNHGETNDKVLDKSIIPQHPNYHPPSNDRDWTPSRSPVNIKDKTFLKPAPFSGILETSKEFPSPIRSSPSKSFIKESSKLLSRTNGIYRRTNRSFVKDEEEKMMDDAGSLSKEQENHIPSVTETEKRKNGSKKEQQISCGEGEMQTTPKKKRLILITRKNSTPSPSWYNFNGSARIEDFISQSHHKKLNSSPSGHDSFGDATDHKGSTINEKGHDSGGTTCIDSNTHNPTNFRAISREELLECLQNGGRSTQEMNS